MEMHVKNECNKCESSYPEKDFKYEKYKFHCQPCGKILFCQPDKRCPETSKSVVFTYMFVNAKKQSS